jgi:hypothetical protein
MARQRYVQQILPSTVQEKRGYKSETQQKNLMWLLPRPKRDHYKGGMPLYAEEWLLQLANEIFGINYDWGKKTLLQVFAGMNKYGLRVDLNKEVKPDYVGDIHRLSKILPKKMLKKFPVIVADPAYSDDENEKLYGLKMHLSYKLWSSECIKFLRPGGLFIVYHKNLMRNPDPERFTVVKRVAIANRVGHVGRFAVFFQMKGGRRQLN